MAASVCSSSESRATLHADRGHAVATGHLDGAWQGCHGREVRMAPASTLHGAPRP